MGYTLTEVTTSGVAVCTDTHRTCSDCPMAQTVVRSPSMIFSAEAVVAKGKELVSAETSGAGACVAILMPPRPEPFDGSWPHLRDR